VPKVPLILFDKAYSFFNNDYRSSMTSIFSSSKFRHPLLNNSGIIIAIFTLSHLALIVSKIKQ